MEPPKDHTATIAKFCLFKNLTPAALRSLAGRMRTIKYRPSTIIFNKDDPGLSCFIITEGLIKIYVTSEEGQEVVLIILKGGDLFGELSLLDGAPRSASAVAMEATEVLALNRQDFLDFVRETPESALAMLSVLSGRLRRADTIIADAAFLDLPTRVAKKLLELADDFGNKVGEAIEIDIRLRQQDFASMVSATRESVNRSLALLEEEGIIKIDRQKITVLKPAVLRKRIEF